jgi:hypothetical protein
VSLIIDQKKKLKSVENYENQLLKSGDFWSGENQQNQETPDQFRRFGNPGLCVTKFLGTKAFESKTNMFVG